jgi:serine/threonine protein kinase
MDCFKDNLKKIIYSKDNKLTIDDIFSIAKQLIEALNILHKSGIVHRDLKL